MRRYIAGGLVCAFALVLPAAGQSKVYIVCQKAGATPVVALAEKKAGGEVAVLAAAEGEAGSCADKSVHEVRTQQQQAAAQAGGKGGQEKAEPGGPARPGGAPPAQAAGLAGGVVPGGSILQSALKEALSKGSAVPAVDGNAPQLAAATRAAVSNVLKTKHDTAKNAIGNIR
jgi:hypothetical protein